MAKITKAQAGKMFPGGKKRTSPSTQSPVTKGPYMFKKDAPSNEQMGKDWQKKEREMTTRKPGPNDLKPLKKGGKIKKACKGTLYPKSSSVSSRLKKGGSFPDLNKDGKITKADILKGRGVIAKKGMKVKKAKDGIVKRISDTKLKDVPGKVMNAGRRLVNKVKNSTVGDVASAATMGLPGTMKSLSNLSKKSSSITKNLKGPAYKKGGSMKKSMKTGGKMTKKCMYGCK
jgi:hypothetical protein